MSPHHEIAIVGGGPSGLMAAEKLSAEGFRVVLFDRMPTMGRKILMAGRGGLNLTHSEPLETFIEKYGEATSWLGPMIRAFPPEALRKWVEDLGEETYVGSSGRVFPRAMKASPLLRKWLARLQRQGVSFHLNHRWMGWNAAGDMLFSTPDGMRVFPRPAATLLALGGASWPHLGSDGLWTKIMAEHKVGVTPLRPANVAAMVNWSDLFRARFAGQPLKPVLVAFKDQKIQGELIITEGGIQGGPIYALGREIRKEMDQEGAALIHLHLRPGLSDEALRAALAAPRGGQSLSNFLRKSLKLSPIAIALIQEYLHAHSEAQKADAAFLLSLIRAYPLRLTGWGPMARAISCAGGIERSAIGPQGDLKALPSVFIAGEMADWEAPTGGYLIQACLSMGVDAAQKIQRFLMKNT